METGRPFVSVKFTDVGRVQTFLLPELAFDPPLNPGDQVLVRSSEGRAVGKVVRTIPALTPKRQAPAQPTDVVIRKATQEDIVARLQQKNREQDASRICQMKIRERGLEMKLAGVEQALDGSRLVFYFTADGRVDFRELVRELAAEFRTRIEMRQIGVRDEAKMLGGYGSCGRPLCCTTWLTSFEPITIKMAKQQDLSLNPSKLSGQCGRLKCCLRYELPNSKGVTHAGCAHHEGGGCGTSGTCGGCSSGGACGGGGCGNCH